MMRLKSVITIVAMLVIVQAHASESDNKQSTSSLKTLTDSVMSAAYWKFWNPEVHKTIEQNIEKYRKADADCRLKNVKAGTEVQITQTSHHFLFGGNIFLFGDLGSPEKNKRYEDTFGSLFNVYLFVL